MTRTQELEMALRGRYQETIPKINKGEISIQIKGAVYLFKIMPKKSVMISRNGHFLMRSRGEVEEILEEFDRVRRKADEVEEMRLVMNGVCEYLRDEGNLPDGYSIISATSTATSGFVNVETPKGNITILARIDPPEALVQQGDRILTKIGLSDPECAEKVKNFIASL